MTEMTLEKCLHVLQTAKSDNEKFAALLLVRIIFGQLSPTQKSTIYRDSLFLESSPGEDGVHSCEE